MNNRIEIDIFNEEDLYEKYNKNFINKDLINYLLNQVSYISKNAEIKIVINSNFFIENDIENKIRNSLIKELEITIKNNNRNNIIQLLLFLIGILFLGLSTLVTKNFIWQELLLITAWVPIWEMVDIKLFKDFKCKRKMKRLKQLVNSKIIIKKFI